MWTEVSRFGIITGVHKLLIQCPEAKNLALWVTKYGADALEPAIKKRIRYGITMPCKLAPCTASAFRWHWCGCAIVELSRARKHKIEKISRSTGRGSDTNKIP